MKNKGKKELDEGDLPPITRALVKVKLVGNKGDIGNRLTKIKSRGVLPITREKIIEFAEVNALYVNPDTWDPKKKLPEGAATVMTPELLLDLYRKYIKEQDLLGMKHKLLCQDTEKAGKEKPIDPRFIEDPKKAKKEPPKKKDPKAIEEPEEKELPESPFESAWEYTYLMFDDFEKDSELLAISDLADVLLLTVNLTGLEKTKVAEPINPKSSREL
jgi:hypothetical protein